MNGCTVQGCKRGPTAIDFEAIVAATLLSVVTLVVCTDVITRLTLLFSFLFCIRQDDMYTSVYFYKKKKLSCFYCDVTYVQYFYALCL